MRAKCFYRHSWEYLGVIGGEHGLEKLQSATEATQFWDGVKSHLLDQVATFRNIRSFYLPLKTVLVAGEASSDPEFVRVVRDVVAAIPAAGEKLELVLSSDPAFAAARGAALWQRLRTEGLHYCRTRACCETWQAPELAEQHREL